MTATRRTSLPPAVAAAFVGAVVAAPLVLGASAAWAAPGTLKIHEPGTAFDVKANEPQVACSFYLAAFDLKNNVNDTLNYSFTVQGGTENGAELMGRQAMPSSA